MQYKLQKQNSWRNLGVEKRGNESLESRLCE